MKIKINNYILLGAWLLWQTTAMSQAPTWSVTPTDYANSMNLVCQVILDGNPENGPSNILGAFVGNEVRGVAQPMLLGGVAYYYLTVHSNEVSGEEIWFKVYRSVPDTYHPAVEKVVFQKNGFLGSSMNGYPIYVSEVDDFPVGLLPFAPNSTLQGVPFGEIALIDHLQSLDDDPVKWSAANGAHLTANIGLGNKLTVSPNDPMWAGTDSVLVTVKELGNVFGYSASRYAVFTVLPDNGIPTFGYLPTQFIQSNLGLPSGNLNDGLTYDGSCLEFGVLLDLPEGETPAPTWVQPLSNSGSMTIVMDVQYNCHSIDGLSNQLAGYVGGQFAGVASPTLSSGGLRYFLTLANLGAGEISLKIYDAERQFLHEKNTGINFSPSATLGTANDPVPADFSPIKITVSPDGKWVSSLTVPDWEGEQRGHFYATDCGFPEKKGTQDVLFLVNKCPAQSLDLDTWGKLCLKGISGANEINWYVGGTFGNTGETFLVEEESVVFYEGTNITDCPIIIGCPVVVQSGIADALEVEISATDPADCGQLFLAPTINDITPPVAVCKNIILYLDGVGAAVLVADALDGGSYASCGIESFSVGQPLFNCQHLGTNNVVLTAHDHGGRTGTCTSVVTVRDTVKPKPVCKNIQIALGQDGDFTLDPSALEDGGTDNCGHVNFWYMTPTMVNCDQEGETIPVIIHVFDGSGNKASCTAQVTVNDDTPPVPICLNPTVQLDAAGNYSLTENDVFGGGTDNCGTVNFTSMNIATVGCGDVNAQIPVLVTANDGHGNEAVCTANVTVQDHIPPTAICKNATVQLDSDGNGSVDANAVDNGSADNCGISARTLDLTVFDCSDVGANNVTMTVIDVNGNQSQCSSIITVEDNVPPVALCTSQIVQVALNADGNYTVDPTDLNDGSSDACGNLSFSANPAVLDCQNEGTNSIVLTVTDASGNSATCSATIEVAAFLAITSLDGTPESCANMADGSIAIVATADAGQVGYSINGGINFQFSGQFNNLAPGTYHVVVKVFGVAAVCEKTATYTITTGSGTTTWYKDFDGDGYTDGITTVGCLMPTGFISQNNPGDCNDSDPNEFPGQIWYEDLDGDGYGSGDWLETCQRPTGCYTAAELTGAEGDCNDNHAIINPGATEICNGVDDDCDGEIDEGSSGGLTWSGNISFTTQAAVNAFSQCYSVIDGNVTINGTGITGLNNLANLAEITGNVNIQSTGLVKLTGLDNLSEIGGKLTIYFNSSLTSLDGLDSLETVGNGLMIYYNFKLSDCCAIYDLLNNNGVTGATVIFYNKIGCNSKPQILSGCAGQNNSVASPGFTFGNIVFETTAQTGISFYPNPAREVLRLVLHDEYETGEVQFFNLHGQLVIQQKLDAKQKHVLLDLNNQSMGVYFLQVSLDGKRFFGRIIIE